MRKFKEFYKKVGAALAVLLVSSGLVFAQVPAIGPPPYNVDLGALLTNTARVPGTYNSATQNNLAYQGVMCTMNQTAVTGTSTVFSIQFLDTASGLWQTMVSSAAITTAVNTPTSIVVAAGLQTSSTTPIAGLPSLMVTMGLKLPRSWRVQEVVTGGTSTTGTIGCTVFR